MERSDGQERGRRERGNRWRSVRCCGIMRAQVCREIGTGAFQFPVKDAEVRPRKTHPDWWYMLVSARCLALSHLTAPDTVLPRCSRTAISHIALPPHPAPPLLALGHLWGQRDMTCKPSRPLLSLHPPDISSQIMPCEECSSCAANALIPPSRREASRSPRYPREWAWGRTFAAASWEAVHVPR
ncbi:hypothetical protein SKAU_G00018070 [Synaphobranchus kaupii]|uniref:Uncharacterized protein n=1 Tax=Synaphobranchus kaupii TaxID=118154 RepID=A0A9Q1JE84_SYNKA|nr:hypothetical protein SKAU_G00018070 [Synaphobranchus kaupii]